MTTLTNTLLIILIVLFITYFVCHIYWDRQNWEVNNAYNSLQEMFKNVQEDFMHEKQNYQKIIDNQKEEIKKWQNLYQNVYYENEKLNNKIKELEKFFNKEDENKKSK